MLTTRKTTKRGRVAALCVALLLAGCTPPGPRALLDGERLLQEGHAEDAVRRLRTAVEFLPGNAQAWNHLGLAFHAARQPAEAAKAYQQALALDRNLAVAHYNLGCLWLDQGDAAKAADAFRTHVGLQPRSAEGWLKLGQAQLRIRQWDLADRSFNSALRLGQPDPEAFNGLGVSLQQRHRNREAWQCFTNAIGLNPRFAPAWLNLAVVAHQAGARPQAIQAYRQFASLRPDRARELGLENVIQRLETNPGPTFQIPPAPTPAASPTNRPAAATPPARPLAAAPTNGVPTVSPGASNAPAQPRAPPRHAEAERPAPAATQAARTTTPTAVSPTPARPAPTNVATSESPSAPAPAPAPTSTSSSRTNDNPTLVVTVPISVRPAAVASNPPTTAATAPALAKASPPPSSNTATATTPVPIPPQLPLEIVAVDAPPDVSTNVRDEPWNAPFPATNAAASRTATTSGEPRPIVRPVGAQHDPESARKPGFWSRANPVKWFGSGKEERPEDAPAPNPTAPAASPAAGDDAGRWGWANPASWFRSSKPESSPAAPTTTTAATSPTNRPAAVRDDLPEPTPTPSRPPAIATAPAGAKPATTNAVGALASASSRRTAADAPTRRYVYLNPPVPVAGDGAAAESVLTEGMREHQRGRLDAAVKLYDEALKLDPGSFDAQHNLAIARLQAGEAPKALAAAETALALRPNSVPARFHFALALDSAGFPADAAVEAEKVVAANADHTEAHLLLGNLYSQKLGKPDRAREHYLRVLDLQPDHPQNTAIRRWLANRR